jgi:hypothetical protein
LWQFGGNLTGLEIAEGCDAACELLKADCGKFRGAAAVELLRKVLMDEGIAVSNRDVYVRGLPIEFDLLALRGAQPPFNGLLYEAKGVNCIIEVKLSGLINAAKALPAMRRIFRAAKAAGMACCYVCICDRRSAIVTERALGFRCFTLTHAVGYGPRLKYEDTGDWPRLLKFLRDAL